MSSGAPDPQFDVAILGAGPAGAAAAIECATLGLRTVVLDEQPQAGGQVYRAAPGIAPVTADHDRAEGNRLRADLAAARVERCFLHRVWHVERDGDGDRWRVHALGPTGPGTFDARALIVATGAQERHLPFAGWDRAGVMGLAAATVMLKAQRVLPGREVVVAGAGPLLLVVAKGIVDGGGRVVAVVDARPRSAWFAEPGALLSRPDLVARGVGWVRALRTARVPVLHSAQLRSVEAVGETLRATVVRLDGDGNPRSDASSMELGCDAVCCGYGLAPATDVTRLAGAAHDFDTARGGWHARCDDDQRSSVAGLYVAGDGAGVAGAAAAPWQGRIAAFAAARDLGRLDANAHATRATTAKRARSRAGRFGGAMARLANVGDGALRMLSADGIVCQCEQLTRATLDAAIADGAVTMNDLKSATRCGMGPCGGRLCEEGAARLVAFGTGHSRAEVGQATGRPPLRPVAIDALAGEFDYAALPIPEPAPL